MATPRPLSPSSNDLHTFLEAHEFRAGKMVFDGRNLQPDTRKGWIRLVKTEDSLRHFQWLERPSSEIVDDLVIFPDQATFEQVGPATRRVFVLKFQSQQLFFWLQFPEAGPAADMQACTDVNNFLNTEDDDLLSYQPDILQPGAAPNEATGDPAFSSWTAPEASSPPGPHADSASAQPPASRAVIGITDLQRILAGITPEGELSGSGALEEERHHLQARGPSLADILKPEEVWKLLDTPAVHSRLAPFLPPAIQSPESMQDLVRSVQFQQQLHTFSELLQTGRVDWHQFGVNQSVLHLGVVNFLEALQDQVPAEADVTQESSKYTGHKPDSMDKGH